MDDPHRETRTYVSRHSRGLFRDGKRSSGHLTITRKTTIVPKVGYPVTQEDFDEFDKKVVRYMKTGVTVFVAFALTVFCLFVWGFIELVQWVTSK